MVKKPESQYGLPIITIYILGHPLENLTEPVIYVKRRYLDYDDQVINETNPFIESLTHDAVIVLLPNLKGRMQNRLERLLSIFDQEYRMKDEHYLELPIEDFPQEEQPVLIRLLKAAASPNIRRNMDIEDEIISEIEARDTVIMVKNKEIQKQEQIIEEKKQTIKEKEEMIEKKEGIIEEKKQIIRQQEQIIRTTIRMLYNQNISLQDIARQLSLSEEKVLKML